MCWMLNSWPCAAVNGKMSIFPDAFRFRIEWVGSDESSTIKEKKIPIAHCISKSPYTSRSHIFLCSTHFADKIWQFISNMCKSVCQLDFYSWWESILSCIDAMILLTFFTKAFSNGITVGFKALYTTSSFQQQVKLIVGGRLWSSNQQHTSFVLCKHKACINPHSFPQAKV